MSNIEEIDFKNILLSGDDNAPEIVPIITDFDGDMGKFKMPKKLPILPLRNAVLFPGVVVPITVGREKSLKLIKEIFKKDKIIGTVTQIDKNVENPTEKDIYKVGTAAEIIKILEMPDNTTSVIIQGKKRFEIQKIESVKPYITASVKELNDIKAKKNDKEFDAIIGSVRDLAIKIIKLSTNVQQEGIFALKNISDSTFLINFICSNTDVKIKGKQNLLETNDLKKRAITLLEYLSTQLQMLELKDDIQSKVKSELDKQQREFLLNQQMKTIRDELGGNPLEQEVEELKVKAKDKKWSKEVEELFNKERNKLQRMNPAAGEYSVQLNYLQILLELPWNEYSEDNFDLKNAQKILDNDHYGLDKVKERILEHLAVLKLKGDLKSPIICLYGPPGVGKTSLGKSIAKSLNRKYVRMSLGGLHDEAEIRGHRKTYIGAMPGRIIQNIRKAKTSNPVFILDEIDKVGNDYHGDPSSALLEVLDPEQNSTFHDNFLDLDYDLSKAMFIATANTLSTISPALRDRMEMIQMSGYIVEEKIEIAKRHLIPKQLEAHGVKQQQLILSKQVVENIIENYTRESGVRELDKQLAKLTRRTAKKIAFKEEYNPNISIEDLNKLLGVQEYSRDKYQGNEFAGVVTGLAWTSVGGEILFIETSLSKGKGTLTLTGNLGDVMKESAILALEYLKAHSKKLNINEDVFEKWNVHVHVPEGAIPKDGPSAGVTMVTSLASAFTQRKVKKNLAMTGEITLRGKVLPVGGIKEKILAAKRANIKEIILSEDNRKDISEIKDIYVKGLKFHYVKNIIDVLDMALLKQKVSSPIDI
ncbi:MAG: endopeptidase La [Bacteroidetes bacterium]|nr:endopeptidase La [Bacteroidota bacterium]